MSSLQIQLDHLYRTFDLSMLSPDPLEVVRCFSRPEDREVAGLIASSLAYGRVETIVETVRSVFSLMDQQPYRFTLHFRPHRDAPRFHPFVYRFTRGNDMVCLVLLIQQALQTFGSLGRMFMAGYHPADANTGPALTHFVDALLEFGCPFLYPGGTIPPDAGVRYLLPSPRAGSACKRLNLFVRWMVRRGDDGIDLGLWRDISPSKLLIPLDTHVARLSRSLKLTMRSQPDWKMAEEVTAALRAFDSEDPVKYDFALCHWGMQQVRKSAKQRINESTNQCTPS